MKNSPTTFWYLLGAAAVFVVVVLIVHGRKVRAAKLEHQRLYETDNFSPADTFSGTLRHICGLPVPAGLSLGTAANRAYGIVFAKGRFRYVIEKKDIESIAIHRRGAGLELPPRRWSPADLIPHLYVEIRLGAGAGRRRLLFTQRLLSPFARRLRSAMQPALSDRLESSGHG